MRKDIKQKFSSTILDRGKSYFTSGRVTNVELSVNFVSAKVKGSKNYHVWISFNKDDSPNQMSCTCPYFEVDNCKHLAALLYQLEVIEFYNSEDEIIIDDELDSEDYDRILNGDFSPKDKSSKNYLPIEKRIFREKFSSFLDSSLKSANTSSSTQIKYRLAYGIEGKGYHTEIFPLRLKLRKDGSVTNVSKVYSLDYKTMPYVNLKEKLIIDYLLGYDNSRLHLGGFHNSRNDLRQEQMYDEILSFLEEKEVYFQANSREYEKVDVLNKEAECKVIINDNKANLNLELSIKIKDESIANPKIIVPILDNPLWIYADNKIFKINGLNTEQLELFFENDLKISIPKKYLTLFEKELLPKIVSQLPIVSNKYEIEELDEQPTKKIFLEESASALLMQVKFGYGKTNLAYNPNEKNTTIFNDDKIIKIIRNNEFENEAVEEIKSLYVKKISVGVFSPRKDPIEFLLKHFSYFEKMGFEVLGQEKLNKLKFNISKPKVSFNVTSGIDWFDVTTEVDYDGATIPFSELVDAIKNKKKYLKLSDGSSGVLPAKWIKKFEQTLSFGKIENESIKFSKLQALALENILDDADDFETDESFNEHINKLKSFDEIKKQTVPRSFKGKLRDYQKFGLDWLLFLKEYSFGGILADDMGLGKTIQSIALLLKEKSENKKYTNLIAAPTSVVFNWIDEINKFAPTLKVLNHTGIKRERKDVKVFEKYDIIITSYGLLRNDLELFYEFQFHYIILDESQKIKNPHSKIGRAVRKYKADYRLCLTGTPIENNLTELWSQMAFLNPGLLGSFKNFNDTFVKPIEKGNDEQTIKLLRQTIYPFILRRTKDVVAKELPEKTETIHYCEMDKEQEKVYNYWKNSIRSEIFKEIDQKGIKKSGFKVLEGLLRLRQISNHPVLVEKDYDKKSAKFEEVKLMITDVVAEGHKILIFSQFVQMLKIIQTYLDKKNIKYEMLTGSTRKREEHINNFKTNDDVKIFLISLKAGGFGLNLTEADYVFHYDPWWNPAVELQATDRTHRIGQDKNVFVYKFITKNSIEEKILHLQEKKRKMVQEIISTESSMLKSLTKDDIKILFE